jgi:hypothetical protein
LVNNTADWVKEVRLVRVVVTIIRSQLRISAVVKGKVIFVGATKIYMDVVIELHSYILGCRRR